MSKQRIQLAKQFICKVSRHLLLRSGRCSRKLLYALVNRRVVVMGLITTIAAELAVLGVGVTRRLDMAYERSLEVSRAQLAVIEARELAQMELNTQGSAGIAASAADDSAPDADAPPPLRVRDVDTILAQEGGFDFTEPEERSI